MEAIRTAPAPQAFEPGLYLVATPIGNLRDITLRALDILSVADRVLAEDTRVAAKLLEAYGLRAKVEPYHDHNAEKARPHILEALAAGERIALISDAGTPLVSDPGYKLARAAIEAGADVFPIPGASAALAALTIAGLPSDRFHFAGFPPAKAGARQSFLAGLAGIDATLILYESANRLAASLAAMAEALGDRPAAVCRELTKKFEEARRGALSELAAHYRDAGPPKGEIVVVIGPPEAQAWDQARVDAALAAALDEAPVKAASADIAALSGWSRRDVYARALALKARAGTDKP